MAGNNKTRRRVFIALGSVVAFYLLLCAFAFVVQRHIVFPAPKIARTPLGPAKLISVDKGTPLLFNPPQEGKPVVVYFHGNGEQIADNAWLAEYFGRRGLGFAAIEYPGYGLAQGTPSEANIFAAAEQGILYLIEKENVDRSRLILAGQSLGTGVAMAMAERGYGNRVLLFCPFTSLSDVGAEVFPFLPARLLLRDRFDSLERAKRVKQAVLVIHGSDDELIPIKLGRRLALEIPRGDFSIVAGGHHNDLWNFPEFTKDVFAFINAKIPE